MTLCFPWRCFWRGQWPLPLRRVIDARPAGTARLAINLPLMSPRDALWLYADDLRRYAAHMCRDSFDAEDVAQTTLLKAAEKVDGFRGEASVRTWLHTIALNECRMLRRKAPPDTFDEAVELALVTGKTGTPVTSTDDPESLAIEAENRREVIAALDRLPDRYQHVLVLKDGCGLRSAEVADVLGSTIPAVKSVLFRARRQLRSNLEPMHKSR